MTDQVDKKSAATDDTKQAPSSDEEPQTTVVASDTATVDRAQLAWSLDNTDEIQLRERGARLVGCTGRTVGRDNRSHNMARGNVFHGPTIDSH